MTEENKMPDVIYACPRGRGREKNVGVWTRYKCGTEPETQYILPTHPVLEGMAEALREIRAFKPTYREQSPEEYMRQVDKICQSGKATGTKRRTRTI